MSQYDKLDCRVLTSMRKDSRAKLLSFISQTRMPKSTVHDRINRLVKHGVRCTTILDWDALGCPFAVFAIMPYESGLSEHVSINSCARLSLDLLIAECLFSTAMELEQFRAEHPGAKLYPIVSVLKREGFMPAPQTDDD